MKFQTEHFSLREWIFFLLRCLCLEIYRLVPISWCSVIYILSGPHDFYVCYPDSCTDTQNIYYFYSRKNTHVLLLLITIVTIKTTILVRCKMAEACTSASFFIFKHTIKILPTNQTSKSFPVHFILRTNTYLSIWYLLSHMFGSLWKMITRAGSIESRLPTTKCFIWWSYYINFDIQYCNLPCPSLSTSVTFSHMWRGFPLFYKYFYGNFFWFAYLFGVSISWI